MSMAWRKTPDDAPVCHVRRTLLMRPQRAYATRQPLLLVLAGTRLRCASRSVPLEAARAAWSLQVTCSSTRGALPLPHSAARWHTRAAPLPAPAMTLQLCESSSRAKGAIFRTQPTMDPSTAVRCSRRCSEQMLAVLCR